MFGWGWGTTGNASNVGFAVGRPRGTSLDIRVLWNWLKGLMMGLRAQKAAGRM